ncbi:Myosin light chain kinase, smooth muscle [Exaiptasia diaphana]|nr:Myosin light chain kinase, smooth muscle [Exaiptasia diaphana]
MQECLESRVMAGDKRLKRNSSYYLFFSQWGAWVQANLVPRTRTFAIQRKSMRQPTADISYEDSRLVFDDSLQSKRLGAKTNPLTSFFLPCPRGFYCPLNESTPRPCPPRTYNDGTTNITYSCKACPNVFTSNKNLFPSGAESIEDCPKTDLPNVTSVQRNRDMLKGDNVVIPCHIESNPPACVTWLFNGKSIQKVITSNFYGQNPIPHIDYSPPYSNLTLYSLKPDQHGQYTCHASNAIGQANYTFHVSVAGFFFFFDLLIKDFTSEEDRKHPIYLKKT